MFSHLSGSLLIINGNQLGFIPKLTCMFSIQSGGIRSDLNVPWVWNDGDISPSQIAYVGPLEQGKSWWSNHRCGTLQIY